MHDQRFLIERRRQENLVRAAAISGNQVHPHAACLSASRIARNRLDGKLFLNLYGPPNSGWGVCGLYFEKELSKIADLHVLSIEDRSSGNTTLDGILFQGLQGADFIPIHPGTRGRKNVGYAFFEKELTAASIRNAASFDLVLCGSTWCLERMHEKGIQNCDVLLQGIDPDIFYPARRSRQDDRFIVFSGGKFELRKGQDLVLRAIKIFQERHSDVWLVTGWYNMWEPSVRMMESSPLIKFRFEPGQSWRENMLRTYLLNGLDPERIITCDLIPNNQLRDLYAQTDLGLFPNRCEGGTNLVMMEYMACGQAVIASNTSGHRDILNSENALCLNALRDLTVVDQNGQKLCRWQEPSLDELLDRLEFAYQNRAALAEIGHKAGESLKQYTWTHAAERLTDILKTLS